LLSMLLPLPPRPPLFPYTTLFRSPGPHREGTRLRRRGQECVLRHDDLLGVGQAQWAKGRGTPAGCPGRDRGAKATSRGLRPLERSEEHTSELQSRENLVCRLLLEK